MVNRFAFIILGFQEPVAEVSWRCGPAHRTWTRSRLMRTIVPMQVFTFFCVERDGSVPRFDVTACADDNAARLRAGELFDMHRGCNEVEVWRGATHLFKVGAGAAA